MLSRDSFEFSEVCIEDVCSACNDFKDQLSKVTPEEIEKIEEFEPIAEGFVCSLAEDTCVFMSLCKCGDAFALNLFVDIYKEELVNGVPTEVGDCYMFDMYISFDFEADIFPQVYRLFRTNEIDVY